MKVKNQPVGTVECPTKACSETCKVFKFRPRTEGRRTVFTDKYYCECPKHGRIGADGNPTVTEYILCNAKMDGADTSKNRTPATTPASSARSQSPRSPSTSTGSQTGSSAGGAPRSSAGEAQPTRTEWRPLIDLD